MLLLAALAVAMQGGAGAAEAPVYGEAPVYAPAPERSKAGSLRIGWVKLNRRSGRAVLFVRVGGPGRVFLWGRGVRRLRRGAARAKVVRLPVKPKVRLLRWLKRHGKGRIRVNVGFESAIGTWRTAERPILLRRARR